MEKFKFIMSWLWLFLKPFIRTFLTEAGRAVAMAATEAVKIAAAMPEGTTGDKRRKAAFAYVRSTLEPAGYKVGANLTESMINAAIEVALQGLKQEQN